LFTENTRLQNKKTIQLMTATPAEKTMQIVPLTTDFGIATYYYRKQFHKESM
jgi:hypothetical protein